MAIRPNSARLHMKISTDFYIFKPVNGSAVEGTVQYVSNNYLSAVIYRVFNVTIKLQSKKRLNIVRGSEIKFIIKSYNMKSNLPYIEGELIDRVAENGLFKTNGIALSSNALKSKIKLEDASNSSLCNATSSQKSIDHPIYNVTENKIEDSNCKHKKVKGEINVEDNMLTDEEMEHSIAAILKNFEREISDDTDSVQDSAKLKASQEFNSKCINTSKRAPTKKRKKVVGCKNIESMREALLNKFASNYENSEKCKNQSPSVLDSVLSEKQPKKRKKVAVTTTNDFEASIMSSLLKVAAEAEKQSNELTISKSHKKESRKSVRFNDTITEASFSVTDEQDLIKVSYLKS
ncbi:uncharacterized protein LOC129732975 isoform X2 [Wyeomyia smithii]|nr:uncharacterized protein LOC129732975 isoform X2 [Wyeomyia smithii]